MLVGWGASEGLSWQGGRSDLTAGFSFTRNNSDSATSPPREATVRVKWTLHLCSTSTEHTVFGAHWPFDVPWRLGGQGEGCLVKARVAVTVHNWHWICKTVLLRYNQHTINGTCLNYTIWQVLTNVHTLEIITTTTTKIMHISITTKRSLFPLVILPLILPPPSITDYHVAASFLST